MDREILLAETKLTLDSIGNDLRLNGRKGLHQPSHRRKCFSMAELFVQENCGWDNAGNLFRPGVRVTQGGHQLTMRGECNGMARRLAAITRTVTTFKAAEALHQIPTGSDPMPFCKAVKAPSLSPLLEREGESRLPDLVVILELERMNAGWKCAAGGWGAEGQQETLKFEFPSRSLAPGLRGPGGNREMAGAGSFTESSRATTGIKTAFASRSAGGI
ncbi:hypothetical protein ABZP36_009777 [Zizania latifolia]